jgi:hypothetical protein
MYHDKMLASVYRADWIFGEWSGPNWQHEHCNCRLISTKSGEKCMLGGHRDRYFSRKGRSRKSRQQQRRYERRRENRLVRQHVLDEMS